MQPLEPWHQIPAEIIPTIGELINRHPRFVADLVQYNGLQLSENSLDQLKIKLDGPSYRAVLKTTKHFY